MDLKYKFCVNQSLLLADPTGTVQIMQIYS